MKIKGLRVLAVDDDALMRELLLAYLNFCEVKNVFKAVNADEALDIIKKEQVDLIISDNDMPPGSSGIELLREIKQYHKHIFFVLISGYDINREAELAGADAFMQKPFTLSEFKGVIKKI